MIKQLLIIYTFIFSAIIGVMLSYAQESINLDNPATTNTIIVAPHRLKAITSEDLS